MSIDKLEGTLPTAMVKLLIDAAVKEAVAEMAETRDAVIKQAVAEAMKGFALTLGIKSDDPIEMQKDLAHLRRWRQSVESVQQKGLITLIGIIATGLAGATWVGFKSALGK